MNTHDSIRKSMLLMVAFLFFGGFAVAQIPNGAKHFWAFEGNAMDSIDSLHGTAVNVNYVYDRHGRANGAAWMTQNDTAHVKLGENLSGLLTNSFSASMWVKPGDTSLSNHMILSKSDFESCSGNPERSMDIRIIGGKANFTYHSDNQISNSFSVTGSTQISDTTKWYHIVCLYDPAQSGGMGKDRVRIFVDNVEETTTMPQPQGMMGPMVPSNAHLGIGSRLDVNGYLSGVCTGQSFDGGIDDVILYAGQLTTNQIDSLYNDAPIIAGRTKIANASKVTAYPNPVNDILKFTAKVQSASLTDLHGRMLKSQSDVNSINVSDLPAGIYILNGTDTQGLSFAPQRIVVQ